MARIRSVHPALFTDEAWVSCSPLARILYIGLWTDADDQGLFEWKPLQIKMRLLAGDMADAGTLLAELESVNLIVAYAADGKKFGAIRNFRKFQRPQKPNALHPLPDRIASYVGLSATDNAPVEEEYATATGNVEQMEDVGGRREEDREVPLANASVPSDLGAVPLEKAKAKLQAIAEEIWALQPVIGGKRRATRPDVAKAFAAAVSRGGDPADILACCRAYYALPDSTKAAGQYAKGADSLLAADRWEEFRPADNAPRAVPVSWKGPQDILEAVCAEIGEDAARSYLLTAEWIPPEAHELLGSIRPRTSYAYDKLARLKCLSSLASLLQPAPRSRAA